MKPIIFFLSVFLSLPLWAQDKPRTDSELLKLPGVKAEKEAFDPIKNKSYSEVGIHLLDGGSLYDGYLLWAKAHKKVLSSSPEFQEYMRPSRYQNKALLERARFEIGRAMVELESESTSVAGLATLINIARMKGTPVYDESRQILVKYKETEAFRKAMELAKKGGGL